MESLSPPTTRTGGVVPPPSGAQGSPSTPPCAGTEVFTDSEGSPSVRPLANGGVGVVGPTPPPGGIPSDSGTGAWPRRGPHPWGGTRTGGPPSRTPP